MSFRFHIYSTDNTDPLLASDSTGWGLDPVEGEYDPRFEWGGRGSHIETLGGRFDQDYGFEITDRKIRIAGRDLSDLVRAALQTKYEAVDQDWHFTHGLGEVFKVRFSRNPLGFVTTLDAPLYARGLYIVSPPPPQYVRYRYVLFLRVVSQVI
jgi:hypothetical protein